MIGIRKFAEARVEITFQILVGELHILERQLSNGTSLGKILETWGPEVVSKNLYVRLRTLDELRDEEITPKGKVKAKRRKKEDLQDVDRGAKEGSGEGTSEAESSS